jgi:integrase
LQVQDSAPAGSFGRFLYGIKSNETKRKYVKRLEWFLNFSKFEGKTTEEKSDSFLKFTKQNDTEATTDIILKYMSFQIGRANNKEISNSTISNFYKPIKLFCDMNSILFNSKVITKGFPYGSQSSNDRIPTREEILEMLKYPDRRLKAIVLTMLSSGIRVGSWEHLQWKHVIPIERNGDIIAAKLIVKNTKVENRNYFTFITPEAYFALKEWMEFRSSQGEKTSPESWLMRDLWNTNKREKTISSKGKPNKDSIRMILDRAWRVQDVKSFSLDSNSKRKYEFKSTHSLRKFFETNALSSKMKLFNVKLLMDHDIGIDKSYFKPTEEELLNDYLNVVDLLTITNENKLQKTLDIDLKERDREVERLQHVVKDMERERGDYEAAIAARMTDATQRIDIAFEQKEKEIAELKHRLEIMNKDWKQFETIFKEERQYNEKMKMETMIEMLQKQEKLENKIAIYERKLQGKNTK